jgi:hypothetical protein
LPHSIGVKQIIPVASLLVNTKPDEKSTVKIAENQDDLFAQKQEKVDLFSVGSPPF